MTNLNKNTTKTPGVLADPDKLLLERYADGELNWFSVLKVKRLLKHNKAAEDYIYSLSALSNLIEETEHLALFSHESEDNDLLEDSWQKISARIEQEEHAALLLGERKVSTRKNSFALSKLSEIFSFDFQGADFRSGWATGWASGLGSAVALSAIFLAVSFSTQSGSHVTDRPSEMASRVDAARVQYVSDEISEDEVNWSITVNNQTPSLPHGSSTSSSTSSSMASHQSVPLEFVSSSSIFNNPVLAFEEDAIGALSNNVIEQILIGSESSVVAKPLAFDDFFASSPIEIDWVRSDGKVQMIQDKDSSGTILWVNKPASSDIKGKETYIIRKRVLESLRSTEGVSQETSSSNLR